LGKHHRKITRQKARNGGFFRAARNRPRRFPESGAMNRRAHALLFAFFALAGAASAQVTVTELGTPAQNSVAYGVAGGQQVGIEAGVPLLWTGTAASATSLLPAGATSGSAFATNGTQQAGWANFTASNGNEHAALWSGTAGSFVDLQPSGAIWSVVAALSATQQGGYAAFSGSTRAILWSGSAASAVDLNPASAGGSSVFAMTAAQQGGYAAFGGVQHAGLWSGSAASFVDLHPAGSSLSLVQAMSGAQQAGSVYFGTTPHAALWSGSAGSFVDLDPTGSSGSVVYAMAGGYEAGVVLYGTHSHAATWNGSAATFYDFQSAITAALGSNYTDSIIRGADYVGGTLYLVGEAIDPLANTSTAFVIASAVPEPAVSALILGAVILAVAWLVLHRRKVQP
jgi:hypothetical protein